MEWKEPLNRWLLAVLIFENAMDLILTQMFWFLGEGNHIAILFHDSFGGFFGLLLMKVIGLAVGIFFLEKGLKFFWLRVMTYFVLDVFYLYIILDWLSWVKWLLIHT